ncbi:unnamed protein product [Rotaria socialis]
MIELCDLSSDESFDSTTPSIISHSSSSVCASVDQCSSLNIKYNASNIKMFLKEQLDKYMLVDNHKLNNWKPSVCWSRFALPAVKDENNQNIIIQNFASCRFCYTTYAFTHGSTKSLNSHKCLKETTLLSMSFRNGKSPSLNSKTDGYSIEEKKILTSLIASCICESIRPISTVEDEGLIKNNSIMFELEWC